MSIMGSCNNRYHDPIELYQEALLELYSNEPSKLDVWIYFLKGKRFTYHPQENSMWPFSSGHFFFYDHPIVLSIPV